MIDDDEDWRPRKHQTVLIGGPCDGQAMTIDHRLTVVQAFIEPATRDIRKPVPLHRYEQQIFAIKRPNGWVEERPFWFWTDMPQDERLAAAKDRLCAS